MSLTPEEKTRMRREHEAKYDRLARWLGIEELKALVPFTREQIIDQLSVDDVHLNGLPLPLWDAQHGAPSKAELCRCCGQVKSAGEPTGVWALLRQALRRDAEQGRLPFVRGWSLSDTVCVLKHVATHYIVTDGAREDV